jgi:hypothetical protein
VNKVSSPAYTINMHHSTQQRKLTCAVSYDKWALRNKYLNRVHLWHPGIEVRRVGNCLTLPMCRTRNCASDIKVKTTTVGHKNYLSSLSSSLSLVNISDRLHAHGYQCDSTLREDQWSWTFRTLLAVISPRKYRLLELSRSLSIVFEDSHVSFTVFR